MSKRSCRQKRGKQSGVWRQQPAILTRKRKVQNHHFEDIESPSPSSDNESTSTSSEFGSPSPLECSGAAYISSDEMVSHSAWTQYRGIHVPVYSNNIPKMPISLPCLVFANPSEVWDLMKYKDVTYPRDDKMLDKHPSLQARMRSILLDWLIEVCEVYKLHRETFYLAQDFIDRYLATEINVPKQRLQLIGITTLFIASKIEEIYPPKLTEYVYVTDGACSDEDILAMELIILKALNWNLTPMTANSWLTVYLQLSNMKNLTKDNGDKFLYPDFSAQKFMEVAQLLDLCILDIGCLGFSYSFLAASALYHFSSKELASSVSGFTFDELSDCIQWMAPYAVEIRESGNMACRFLHGVTIDQQHNIQLHTVDMGLLENAQNRKKASELSSRSSPLLSGGMLTPPHSEEKEKSSHCL